MEDRKSSEMASTAKQAAAEAAVGLVPPGARIALGTGSTMELCLPGLARIPGLVATPTSELIAERARAVGITLAPVGPEYDLYLDGADQVAPTGDAVKGSWGAHVREKCLAGLAKRRVLVCDKSKLVPYLTGPVPVAVLPYFADLYDGSDDHRLDDNRLVIVGLNPGLPITDPAGWDADARRLPGVLFTGLFTAEFVHQILIGHDDGSVEVRETVPVSES